MSMGQKLSNEVITWSVLAMVIVIISVILLKVRINSTVVCPTNYQYEANASILTSNANGLCCLDTGCVLGNTSVNSMYGDLGTYVSAFSEPKNWIVIVIIALIGIGLIVYFKKTMNQ